jgi:RNA polymerase sigma factor (sigma-70 family)
LINESILNDWITNNYKELLNICRKVSKEYYCDDLFQSCIEQFIKNKKTIDLPDKEKIYFFTRLVSNNWNSTQSPFAQTYRKYKFVETNIQEIEKMDVEYVEGIDLDWVHQQIEEIKKEEWYYGRLFELYLEEGCNITKLSKRTTIPMNSVSRDINRIRKKLIQKRKKYYDEL